MNNKYMKWYLLIVNLVNDKYKYNNMKYQYTPNGMVEIINKKTDNNKCSQLCETNETCTYWW